MWCYHFSTTTATPALASVSQSGEFWGYSATYAESTSYYVKLWWQGNNNSAPVIGTTAPNLTIPVGTLGLLTVFNKPVIMQGPIYYAVTKNAADTDDTALSTGGDVVTLFLG
jgi:hypothetical protein